MNLSHEQLVITAGKPLAFASGSKPESANHEQLPDHGMCVLAAQASLVVVVDDPAKHQINQDREEREHDGLLLVPVAGSTVTTSCDKGRDRMTWMDGRRLA